MFDFSKRRPHSPLFVLQILFGQTNRRPGNAAALRVAPNFLHTKRGHTAGLNLREVASKCHSLTIVGVLILLTSQVPRLSLLIQKTDERLVPAGEGIGQYNRIAPVVGGKLDLWADRRLGMASGLTVANSLIVDPIWYVDLSTHTHCLVNGHIDHLAHASRFPTNQRADGSDE